MAEYHHTPEPHSAKAKYPTTRQLTVLETARNSRGRTGSLGINYVPVNLEPCLVLSGKWFKEAGFIIGEKVTVTVNQGELVIKPSPALSALAAK